MALGSITITLELLIGAIWLTRWTLTYFLFTNGANLMIESAT